MSDLPAVVTWAAPAVITGAAPAVVTGAGVVPGARERGEVGARGAEVGRE